MTLRLTKRTASNDAVILEDGIFERGLFLFVILVLLCYDKLGNPRYELPQVQPTCSQSFANSSSLAKVLATINGKHAEASR